MCYVCMCRLFVLKVSNVVFFFYRFGVAAVVDTHLSCDHNTSTVRTPCQSVYSPLPSNPLSLSLSHFLLPLYHSPSTIAHIFSMAVPTPHSHSFTSSHSFLSLVTSLMRPQGKVSINITELATVAWPWRGKKENEGDGSREEKEGEKRRREGCLVRGIS